MPVDPAVKVLLDAMRSRGTPALEELSVEDARALTKSFGANQHLEDVAFSAAGSVEGVPVRVNRGDGVADDAPVLVWFHGGGFVVGDTERAEPTARRLANRVPARVVSVEYRLAPEHPYPAAVGDARTVLAWVGGQNVPVAVGGESAGANLAALMAIEARDRGIEVCHQVLAYPWTDLALRQPSVDENADGYWLTKSTLQWFAGLYLGDRADPVDPKVSPLHVDDLAGVAPATVITAEYDPLRDDGNRYAERLRSAGVDVDHHCYPGMIHGLFGLVGVTPVAAEAVERAAANVRVALTSPRPLSG